MSLIVSLHKSASLPHSDHIVFSRSQPPPDAHGYGNLDDTGQAGDVSQLYRRQAWTIRWLALLLLAVAGALVWTVWQHRQVSAVGAAGNWEPRPITARGDLAQDEATTIDLFDSLSPSVVHITSLVKQTTRDRRRLNILAIPQGTGSGFMWDDSGHIVTNYHVIKDADRVQVTLHDNSIWPGSIVGTAPDKDLAVVKIDAPAELVRPIGVGLSAKLQVGQKVFAIGNPFGLDQTLTTGVISGLNREIQAVTQRPIYGVIQTDAAINPGNSGGPLLDSAGLLIGVNTAIYSPSGTYAGIGFAVPVDTVNRIVPQLIQSGRVIRPGLGIIPVSDELAANNNIVGVIVRHVFEDTAADRAGLRGLTAAPGGRGVISDVIVGIDDIPVGDLNDLYRILDQRNVGDEVTLRVQRGAERIDVTLRLQDLPP